MTQKVQQLLPVHQQYLLHRHALVRVRHKDFENVEPLILHHFPVVSEQVHADLQVLPPVDVGGHDVVV